VLAFTRDRTARFLMAEREAIIAELERDKAEYLAFDPTGAYERIV
jgi:hypothetical protein